MDFFNTFSQAPRRPFKSRSDKARVCAQLG